MSNNPATSLIVIDMQRAFDQWEAAGKRRNNPEAVARIADLLRAFRNHNTPVFHIRHQGTRPNSSFLPDGPGYPVKDEAREIVGEPVIVKRVNSAFIDTDLENRLRAAGIKTLVICGATWTFDRTGPDGDVHSAADIHAMTLANLNGEFARIVTAAEVIAALETA